MGQQSSPITQVVLDEECEEVSVIGRKEEGLDERFGEEARDGVDLGFLHGADEESAVREMVGLREVVEGLLLGEGEGGEKGAGLGEWGRGAVKRGAREGERERGEIKGAAVVAGEEWFERGVEREGEREG